MWEQRLDPAPPLPGLVELAARAYVAHDPALRRLDLQRQLTPDWLQSPGTLGYACCTERFAGDLRSVADRLDYLDELGVSYLHLMPLLTPREGDSDGGYAVADYRTVRADLGTMDDLRELTATLRAHGITSSWISSSTTSPPSTSGPCGREPGSSATGTTSTSATLHRGGDGHVWIPPYGVYWLTHR